MTKLERLLKTKDDLENKLDEIVQRNLNDKTIPSEEDVKMIRELNKHLTEIKLEIRAIESEEYRKTEGET